MKFFENKVVKVVMLVMFFTIVSIASVIIYSSTKPVLANENVNVKYFNEEMNKIEEKINLLNTEIAELKSTVDVLKNENADLKTNLEKVTSENKTKLTSFENNLGSLSKRTDKIEARENYLYEKASDGRIPTVVVMRYILENLK